jgi:hypothetical protein
MPQMVASTSDYAMDLATDAMTSLGSGAVGIASVTNIRLTIDKQTIIKYTHIRKVVSDDEPYLHDGR